MVNIFMFIPCDPNSSKLGLGGEAGTLLLSAYRRAKPRKEWLRGGHANRHELSLPFIKSSYRVICCWLMMDNFILQSSSRRI